MALSIDEIRAEVEKHQGYELVSADGYKNMLSAISVKCPKGHIFKTTVEEVRHPSFKCPICAKMAFADIGRVVPTKEASTYRIIAFDQATYKVGMSI